MNSPPRKADTGPELPDAKTGADTAGSAGTALTSMAPEAIG